MWCIQCSMLRQVKDCKHSFPELFFLAYFFTKKWYLVLFMPSFFPFWQLSVYVYVNPSIIRSLYRVLFNLLLVFSSFSKVFHKKIQRCQVYFFESKKGVIKLYKLAITLFKKILHKSSTKVWKTCIVHCGANSDRKKWKEADI